MRPMDRNVTLLEALRSFVGSWAAKILLVVLVGSFALWGIEGTILSSGDSTTVARVGETRVSPSEFLGVYNRRLNATQQQLGRRLTREEGRLFGIESGALAQVVSSAVLDEYARVQGLSLSDDTLARLIRENEAFRDSSGRFNRDNFTRAIYEAQMREADFIEMQNAAGIRSQLAEAFTTGQVLPDVFNAALAQFTTEERQFDYFTVTPDSIEPPQAPTDEQLQAYFDANKSRYRAPEYRKLVVLSVEPKDIADEGAVTDEDIAKDYEARRATYVTPEKRRVQQLVFASKDNADAAVKALSEGALFETIVTENGKSMSDIDLGLVDQASLPKAVADVAFSQPLNETSGIIDGPFGPTMVRVTEVEESKTTPLAEVSDRIRRDIALQRAADAIISMQETVEDTRAGGASIEQTAERLGLSARTIEAIDAEGRDIEGNQVKDLPAGQTLLSQAFRTEVGEQASPVDFGSAGYAWYDVISVTPDRDRSLDEIRQRVVTDWTAEETAKAVAAKAEEFRSRIEKGEELAEVAQKAGLEVAQTKHLKRNQSDAGFPAPAVAAGFAGDRNHVAIASGESSTQQIVLKVSDLKRPEAAVAELPGNIVEVANEGAADDLLSQLVVKLQGEYEVTQNPTLIDQLLTR